MLEEVGNGPSANIVGHVFETTDGGLTWGNVSIGLPDVPADDVVYVNGNISFNSGSGNLNHTPLVYSGKGTVVATGNIDFHTNVVSNGTCWAFSS